VISHAKRFPMMANYQVVIVKEAQTIEKIEKFFKNKNEEDVKDVDASKNKKKSPDTVNPLLKYLESPLKSTILVFCYKYKTFDSRTALAKLIEKNGILFKSAKIYDSRIPQWINEYVAEIGYSISPKAASILAEYLGNDLGKIVNEINKIIINIPQKSEITDKQIYDNIGLSKDFNIFELQNAIIKKDAFKANRIINHFASNLKENPIIKNIPILFSFFNKLLFYHSLKDKSNKNVAVQLSINPFFVQDYITAGKNYSMGKVINIISCLREYDLKAKGIDSPSISEGELYKEMLYKILH
jgi:DNA polymerase-3 subunit delta